MSVVPLLLGVAIAFGLLAAIAFMAYDSTSDRGSPDEGEPPPPSS